MKLLSKHQSEYRKYHSTESAVSDALQATEHGDITLLGLPDLSAILTQSNMIS